MATFATCAHTVGSYGGPYLPRVVLCAANLSAGLEGNRLLLGLLALSALVKTSSHPDDSEDVAVSISWKTF